MLRGKYVITGLLLLIALMCSGSWVWAETTEWTGAINNYSWNATDTDEEGNSITNWNKGIPDASKDALVTGGEGYPKIYFSNPLYHAYAHNLYLGKNLDLSGNLTVTKDMSVGYGGSAAVMQSAPSLLTNLSVGGKLVIGDSSEGSFTQDSLHTLVKNSMGSLVLGNSAGVQGTYNLSRGLLEIYTGNFVVGDKGTGIFNHSMNDGEFGMVELKGTSQLIIGNQGTGTYNHARGHVRTENDMILGKDQYASGTYNMVHGDTSSTTLVVGSNEAKKSVIVGDAGQGIFNQDYGYVKATQDMILGREGTGYGKYTIGNSSANPGDNALLRTDNDLVVGGKGTGDFYQYQKSGPSEVKVVGNLVIGAESSGTGNFTQYGGDTLVSRTLEVGRAGTGTLVQEDGAIHVGHNLVLGSQPGATGTMKQSNGTIESSYSMLVGDGGKGTYTINSGSLNVGNVSVGVQHDSEGKFYQNSGSIAVSDTLNIGIKGDGYYYMGGGILTVGNLIIGDDEGWGKMVTTGATPVITVAQEMVLGERSSFWPGPGLTITMTGSNFINKLTNPDNPDDMTFSNLTMIFAGGEGVIDTFEAGGQKFKLGTLQIGGDKPGYVQLVDLFDNNGIEGMEAFFVAHLILNGGSTLDLHGLSLVCDDITYNGGRIIDTSAVPLPGAVWLLGSGLLGLVGLRRFRKS